MPSPAINVAIDLPEDKVEEMVSNALLAGFRHINTSSLAGHELAIANAVRTSGIARSRLFITTTYDRASTNADGQGVDTECYTHLFKLRMRYVDLLLVGSHRAGSPAHEVWPGMEGLVKNGLVKSIGVKDYGVHDLDELVRLPSFGLKPVVNQIEIDAYDVRRMRSLMDLHHQHKIVTQSYAVLDPITKQPGGPVHVLAEEIAWKKGWTVDQVLLSWAKQQGLAVVVTGTSPAQQAAELAAFDPSASALTPAEIDALGRVGREWEHPMTWPGKEQLKLHEFSRDAFHRA